MSQQVFAATWRDHYYCVVRGRPRPSLFGKSNVSWYGFHPRYSKAEIKALLPAAACKHCVYWFRCAVGSSPDTWHHNYTRCPRCGIAQWDLLAELNERLLGLSTPHEPRHTPSIPATTVSPEPSADNASLNKWLTLYGSENLTIRIRAATALVARPDTPLPTLLDILDNLSFCGLGASTQKALLTRVEPDAIEAMVTRLDSSDDFLREVACNVLGHSSSFAATPHLLRMLDDPQMMVRRAAGFALSRLKDSSALPELKRQFAARQNDDTNVVLALRCALRSLGVNA